MKDGNETAVDRAKKLIDALNKEGGGWVVNGLLQAWLYAKANEIDAKERPLGLDGFGI